jgi:glycosyltransferase involved in cell wall biosynthesis
MSRAPGMRLAIAHDALVYAGGAERVVAALVERWPGVPVFTSAYLPDCTFPAFRRADVRTSFVQLLARDPNTVMRTIFPLMVPGFRRFDFSDYDVVLSSAAYAAKTIRVPRTTCHICYCYSPLRLAWRPQDYIGPNSSGLKRRALEVLAGRLRTWDFGVAQKVDYFATTCHNVARRIKDAYRRDAEVIHAPIEFARYHVAASPGDYYLVVSRLNHYKRVDLAIEAAARLGRRLIVVGDGPQGADLERLAGRGNVSFLRRVPDEVLLDLYANCRALIFPQEEDYGLTPLEAQASGRPVVAYRAGGALETIVDGETGVFFAEQTPDALMEALATLERQRFDPDRIRRHAARFDASAFSERMTEFIERKWTEFRSSVFEERATRAAAARV